MQVSLHAKLKLHKASNQDNITRKEEFKPYLVSREESHIAENLYIDTNKTMGSLRLNSEPLCSADNFSVLHVEQNPPWRNIHAQLLP